MSNNKPIFKDFGNYYGEYYCPHCQKRLAHGCTLGMTITLYKECPYCKKELEWDFERPQPDIIEK